MGYRHDPASYAPNERTDRAAGHDHQHAQQQDQSLEPDAKDSTAPGESAREGPAPDQSAPTAREAPSLDEAEQHADSTLLKGYRRPISISAAMLTWLVVLASIHFLYFAKQLVLPILFAIVLNFLLSPFVRWLHRPWILRPIIATVLIFGLAATALVGAYALSGPARQFVQTAQRRVRTIEYELRNVLRPVEEMQETARQVEEATGGADGEEVVAVSGPRLPQTAMAYARSLGAGLLMTGILLLFLLSLDEIFLHKLVTVLRTSHDKRVAVEVMRHIENDVSRYLITITLINVALGAATALVLKLIGVPSPVLWGVTVALLNYGSYLGPMVATVGHHQDRQRSHQAAEYRQHVSVRHRKVRGGFPSRFAT